MENKISKKRKFNAVDAAIIIVIIAIVGVAAFLLSTGKIGKTTDTVMLEYSVEIRQIHDDFVDNFKVGDQMVDSVQKYNIGKVIAVDYENAVYVGTDLSTGTLTAYDYPDHSTVTLTVLAEAIIGDNGRYIIDGGYDLSVGTPVYVRLPDFNGMGFCTAFRETEVTAE